MNIIHVCLSSHYTEGMTYQDNLLPLQNSLDGHNVTIISDCYAYDNGKLIKKTEEDTIINNNIRLIRLEYRWIICNIVTNKVRKTSGLLKILTSIKPDVILFHGTAGWELLTVAKYKKTHPHIKLFVDSHQDLNNSAKNFLSYWVLHKVFYKSIVHKIAPYVDKFLYISYEASEFLQKVYDIREDLMEFFPIGGNIIDKQNKAKHSNIIRKKLNLKEKDIIIIHTGKLDKLKRTDEIIRAFNKVNTNTLKLIILGSIPDERKGYLSKLIASNRNIFFLGWRNSNEMTMYLSASNLYFQPGSQSATLQSAICCGLPIAIFPYESHKPYIDGNGFWIEKEEDFIRVFNLIQNNPEILVTMSQKSYDLAYRLLDYKKIAARLY